MKNYIVQHEWKIVEQGFDAPNNEITESLMSLGNGRMGGRGNFEERFTGKTLQGNYVAGVWFPDKTRVGWWKNGYPRYFAKVINACNWVGIDVEIDGVQVDLNTCEVLDFERALDMQHGLLERRCSLRLKNGKEIRIESTRFCSIVDDFAGAIKYEVTPLNFAGNISLTPYLDGDISNKDTNYGEKFWDEVSRNVTEGNGFLHLRTSKNNFDVERFDVLTAMKVTVNLPHKTTVVSHDKYIANTITVDVTQNQTVTLWKYAINLSSNNCEIEHLEQKAAEYLEAFAAKDVLTEQKQAWLAKWQQNDIEITGDVSAQQGIRFNIFQLQQTYTGQDARLNIGPKGFTGEKYGGSTYWDTEAYCLPFYLSTADQSVARNLLIYRHNQLQKAIDNAAMLGFDNGAALYPMVTMTGEECHNEWEITFEEIHRNGAIAYGIYDYVNYTGDTAYLAEYGLDVLISICRFWVQRVNWSGDKQKYVMLGVTGPNEYENNVNNNWYTNYIATWCLRYTMESLVVSRQSLVESDNSQVQRPTSNVQRPTEEELYHWQHIVDNMYFPYDAEREVFLQQDGFLDKDLMSVDDISEHRPINQKWSWDRILRSCFIKQADVLQGLYFFENDFDVETIGRNFDFYEPMTVHESSLSPCVHVILATLLGKKEKAYEMYLRTSRLDLDDYNNDTEDGLHITSMAGTWLSVIKGFAGMRVNNGELTFKPFLPEQWKSLSFRIMFRGEVFSVKIEENEAKVLRVMRDK